jgi:hypothetical protein
MSQRDEIGATLEQPPTYLWERGMLLQRVIVALSLQIPYLYTSNLLLVRPSLRNLLFTDPSRILIRIFFLSVCFSAAIILAASALSQTSSANGESPGGTGAPQSEGETATTEQVGLGRGAETEGTRATPKETFLTNRIETDDKKLLDLMPLNTVSLLILISYVILCFFARYLLIIVSNINHVCATRDIINARINFLTDYDRQQPKLDLKTMHDLIAASEKYVPSQRSGAMERIIASFGFTENISSAWRILHEAERQLAVSGTPPARWSRSQAIVLLARLQRLPDSPVKLRRELQKIVAADDTDSRIVPLVHEARAFVFEADDNKFAAVADARNKGNFLFLGAVISVIPIVFFFSNTVVLLFAGAVGGILSRLRKAVRQENPLFDLGLDWSVIQLSPIVGALSGFFGLMIFEVLVVLGIAGDMFSAVNLAQPTGWSVVLAFVFGWSATLFDTFLERVEGRMRMSPEQRELSQEIETEAGLEQTDEARKEIERLVKENERLLTKLPAQERARLSAEERKGGGE